MAEMYRIFPCMMNRQISHNPQFFHIWHLYYNYFQILDILNYNDMCNWHLVQVPLLDSELSVTVTIEKLLSK